MGILSGHWKLSVDFFSFFSFNYFQVQAKHNPLITFSKNFFHFSRAMVTFENRSLVLFWNETSSGSYRRAILPAVIPTGLTFEDQYKARLRNLDTAIGGSSKDILQLFCAYFQLFRASGTSYHRGTQRLFSENICSKKQTLPRIFFCLRTAKNFQMNVPFMYNFRSLSNKFPTIF